MPPLPLSAPCLLHGTLVGVVEGERAGRGEADVKVLVADLVDSGIGVVCDVNAFKFQEEDLCEMDVVEGVRDLDLVLEGLGCGVGVGGERDGPGGCSGLPAFLGCLSCECDGGDVGRSAAVLHLWRESCREGEKRRREWSPPNR